MVSAKQFIRFWLLIGLLIATLATLVLAIRFWSPRADVSQTNQPINNAVDQYPAGRPDGAAVGGVVVREQNQWPIAGPSGLLEYGPGCFDGPSPNATPRPNQTAATVVAYSASNPSADYQFSASTDNRCEYFLSLPAASYYICAFAPKEKIPKKFEELDSAAQALCADQPNQSGQPAISELTKHRDHDVHRLAIITQGLLEVEVNYSQNYNYTNPDGTTTSQTETGDLSGAAAVIRCHVDEERLEGLTSYYDPWSGGEVGLATFYINPSSRVNQPWPRECDIDVNYTYVDQNGASRQITGHDVASVGPYAPPSQPAVRRIISLTLPSLNYSSSAAAAAARAASKQSNNSPALETAARTAAVGPASGKRTIKRPTTKLPYQVSNAGKEYNAAIISGSVVNEFEAPVSPAAIVLTPQFDSYDNTTGAVLPPIVSTASINGGSFIITGNPPAGQPPTNQPRLVINQNNPFIVSINDSNFELLEVRLPDGSLANDRRISLSATSYSNGNELTPYQIKGLRLKVKDKRALVLAGTAQLIEPTQVNPNPEPVDLTGQWVVGQRGADGAVVEATKMIFDQATGFNYQKDGHPRAGNLYSVIFRPADAIYAEIEGYYRKLGNDLTRLADNTRIDLNQNTTLTEIVVKLQKRDYSLTGSSLGLGGVAGDDLKGTFSLFEGASQSTLVVYPNTDRFDLASVSGHPRANNDYRVEFIPNNRQKVEIEGYYLNGQQLNLPASFRLTPVLARANLEVRLREIGSTLSVSVSNQPLPDDVLPAPGAGSAINGQPTGPGDPIRLYQVAAGQNSLPILNQAEAKTLYSGLKAVDKTQAELWTGQASTVYQAKLINAVGGQLVRLLPRTNFSRLALEGLVLNNPNYRLQINGANNFSGLCLVSRKKQGRRFSVEYRRLNQLFDLMTEAKPTVTLRSNRDNLVTFTPNGGGERALIWPSRADSPTKLQSKTRFSKKDLTKAAVITTDSGAGGWPTTDVAKVKACLGQQ